MKKFDAMVKSIGKYRVGNRTTYKTFDFITNCYTSRFGIITGIKTHADGLVEIFVRDTQTNDRNCKFVKFDPQTDKELETLY